MAFLNFPTHFDISNPSSDIASPRYIQQKFSVPSKFVKTRVHYTTFLVSLLVMLMYLLGDSAGRGIIYFNF